MTNWYPLGQYNSLISWYLLLLQKKLFFRLCSLTRYCQNRKNKVHGLLCRVTKALNNYFEGRDSNKNKPQRKNAKFVSRDVLIY